MLAKKKAYEKAGGDKYNGVFASEIRMQDWRKEIEKFFYRN